MNKVNIAEKSFDEWAELAKNDPSTFEQMRLAAIDRYIESAPYHSRARLRRMQWRIDQERRLARNPLNACLRMTRMMWDSVLGRGGLREHFEHLNGLLGGAKHPPSAAVTPVEERESAQVLAFARAAD
jgi:hypothetical protein